MRIVNLYSAYAAMEQLPVDARAVEAATAKRRSDALARLKGRASHAKQETEGAKGELLAALRSEAKVSSSMGAIPKSGIAATGAQPNFNGVRSLRKKLEGLLADKTRALKDLERLQSELDVLEKQIAEELRNNGLWARAKLADAITCSVGVLGVLLSIVSGPALQGVAILAVTLAIVGYRLRGTSAMMMCAAQRRPALGSHQRFRLGFILAICGGVAVMTLSVSGFLARPNIDAYWYLGMIGAITIIVAGRKAQRSTS